MLTRDVRGTSLPPRLVGQPQTQGGNMAVKVAVIYYSATGKLVNKVCSSFTSAATTHGGQESTILALNNTFYHWGSIIVGPGYADPIQFQSGNPYGVSFKSDNGQARPDETTLNAARFQGRRVAEVAAQFAAGRQQ